MRKFRKPPRLLLLILASLFAAATLIFSGAWMYLINKAATHVQLGFDTKFDSAQDCQLVTQIFPGSPAARAGLKSGDCILRLNGVRLNTSIRMFKIYVHERPGDLAKLTIKRPHVAAPLILYAKFGAPRFRSHEGGAVRLLMGIANGYPVLFLVVGLTVLFLRVDDRNAWLLALMFGGFIGSGPGLPFVLLRPWLGGFAQTYRAIFDGYVGALFYLFFSVFPVRSPLDCRAPWLKWAGFALATPVVLVGFQRRVHLFARAASGAGHIILTAFVYGFFVLGLVSLISTALAPSTPAKARRKTRMILWGTLVGVVPTLAAAGGFEFFNIRLPLSLQLLTVALLLVFPLSFAYAVVKHQVLEIPILLKRSARYVLVWRGFVLLAALTTAAAVVLFIVVYMHFSHQESPLALPTGIGVGVAFGSISTLVNLQVHRRVSRRIDRAFFRSAYDARNILENLALSIRKVRGREELGDLLVGEINQALHPAGIAVYLKASDGRLRSYRTAGEAASASAVLPNLPLLEELQRQGGPLEIPSMANDSASMPPELQALRPECLIPLAGAAGQLIGVIVLGARLSEEPYSGEDKRLLASVANQAALALEGILLGEEVADRIEVERRAAQEMEFARDVQAHLFPRELPPIATLEYAGLCLQARQVGGDYYDFLELRPGRLALVLADISGKGVSGALLMANLQAILRSQPAMALDDPMQLLSTVNQLFYKNTGDNSYATLFFADYSDASRHLRYANCGHFPPLLLRGAGCPDEAAVEHLEPTAGVLGLFDNWRCEVAQVELRPGDILALYTDGVIEASNDAGEEFGEARLVEALRSQRHLPLDLLLDTVARTVARFSSGEQADDITLVVARSR